MENPDCIGSARGNFFAVDKGLWREALALGMPSAVFYLVLARGSKGISGISTWSVDAAKRHIGLAINRGQEARDRLINAGLLIQEARGTKPRYRLTTVPEYLAITQRRVSLSTQDRTTLRLMPTARRPRKGSWRAQSEQRLKATGIPLDLLQRSGDPPFIWLPNRLIDSDNCVKSPVQILRQAQDLQQLQLLVELYEAHNLRDDGGISRHLYRRPYEAVRLGGKSRWEVYCFKPLEPEFNLKEPFEAFLDASGRTGSRAPLAQALDLFESNGFIQIVPHLCESPDPDSEIIHPLAIYSGIEMEELLARSASRAAVCLHRNLSEADVKYPDVLVPINRQRFPNACVTGILRLRYRPHTGRTTAWFSELKQKYEAYMRQYRDLSGIPFR